MWALWRSLSLLLLFALTSSGCSALLPRQELQDFRTAFLEAQKAGDLLYDEISVAVGAEASAVCGKDPSGNPMCFDPDQVVSGTRRHEDPSIRARRVALELISEYTLALVELAEGNSANELRNNISRVADLASGLGGLLGGPASSVLGTLATGPIVATFTDMAVQIESVRSASELRRSLIAERETVAELIDLLIADTEVMYEVYYAHQLLVAARTASAADLRRATDYHESLTAYVLILKEAKASHVRLVRAAQRPITSLGDVRVVIEEAVRIKTSSQAFWNAIRDVRT